MTLWMKLWLLNKLVRPILPISAGLTTWILSQACGSSKLVSLTAALSIALCTVASSFYHYGGANWMYTRKSERFKFKDPQILILAGIITFATSIAIAVQWLPKQCVYTLLFNTVAIASYSAKLSAHWTTKNVTMSAVCATPVVMGWMAGSKTHPIVYLAIAIACVAHLAREMIKDVHDIIANGGIRVTLPMRLGKERVLVIAGTLILIVAGLIVDMMFYFANNRFQQGMFLLATAICTATSWSLIRFKLPRQSETDVTMALLLLMIALV